ncbi:MAG: DNA repair protein RecO [Alphaproteobacteria bacterium 64-11]|nr:DNA repair protein RecO [Alphaproteobacteria bacterium]OJU08761.1 MAG: DNA repair protein RecO [Alphaproteobacteria bacterium 64-11]
MMEWSDHAIVLSSRAHGETGAILELLTRDHGRHLGLVRGGASRRVKPSLQPGNAVHVHWRARLEEHLGSFTCELARARAGDLMESREGLCGLNAFAAVSSAALPEREAHANVFEAGTILLDAMVQEDAAHWLPLYVRWEAGLLDALGFGLDLSECAATGETDDLAYVSPRSGRAVSRAGAGIYASRMFRLPAFLAGENGAAPDPDETSAGLKLTGHFLLERVLRPHGKEMPIARTRLDAIAPESSKS